MLACIDDSGNEPQSLFFVLGGFMAQATQWALFADEWKAALHKEPRIEYFKFNEAMGLKKQFDKDKGWDEERRDKKLDGLVDVIVKYAQVRVHATIRHDEFDRYFHSIPAPKRHLSIENPYVLLAMQTVLAVAVYSPVLDIFEPCDFIFDQQGKFGESLKQWYPIFKRQAQTSAKTDIGAYLGKPPQFEKDIDFMPLQAADLYAGLIRRHCVNSKLLIVAPPPPLRRLAPLPEIPRNYMAPELKRLNEH